MKNDIVWDTDYALFLAETKAFFSNFKLMDAAELTAYFSELLKKKGNQHKALIFLFNGWSMFDMMIMEPRWHRKAFYIVMPDYYEDGADPETDVALAVAARLRDRLSYSRSLPVLPKSDELVYSGALVRGQMLRVAYFSKLRQLVDLDCDKIVRVFRSIHELRGGVEQDTVDGWLRDAGY